MHCANALQLDSSFFVYAYRARLAIFHSRETVNIHFFFFFNIETSIWGYVNFNFIYDMCPEISNWISKFNACTRKREWLILISSCSFKNVQFFNLLNKIASCCLNPHANNIYTTNERGRTQVQRNFVEISVENSN